ncbi:MAG: hypothetical protein GX801_09835 [Fibrobacter sp.]|nr:hypothetical protein [Fibrobacter sp.]
MKHFFIIISIVLISSFNSCKKDNNLSTEQNKSEISLKKFSAPEETTINQQTANSYVKTSTALHLLAKDWVTQLESTQNAEERVLILGGFEKARDQLIRKIGLEGIEHFNWISTVAIKDQKNKDVFEKAGLHIASE